MQTKNSTIKKRLMTYLVLFSLFCSFMAIIPIQTTATSNSVTVSKTSDLTCGEKIWVNVTDESLSYNTRYYIKIWDGSDWENIVNKKADQNGNLAVSFHIPYRNMLRSYNLSLWDSIDTSGSKIGNDAILWINNSFKVEFRINNQIVDHVIYNKEYAYPDSLSFYVYNWTGTKYELYKKTVLISMFNPEGTYELSHITKTGIWDIDYTFNYTDGANLETNYWINVTDSNTDANSNISLPVKLDISFTFLSSLTWGETLSISGYVKDGKDDPIKNYPIRLYSPTSYGYVVIASTNTFATGRFSLSAPTDEGSAGKWYIGTYLSGNYRVDETDQLPINHFIQYASIDVEPDEKISISIESPEIIIADFTQTLNVSIRNNWDDAYFDEMWIQVTGLDLMYDGISYDADDVIVVHTNAADFISSNGKYAYYEFNILFNETGTGSLIISYPLNESNYEQKTDLLANLTKTIDFQVSSSDDMNMIVENMPSYVLVNKDDCAWKNKSQIITVKIYGNGQTDPMNADLTLTGCGVDITIDEDEANDYWNSEGVYLIPISPKYAGTLTIAASNETEKLSTSKDFSIKGLTGSVSTSILDDKEISIESSESILVTIVNGEYAEIHVTYYDKNWQFIGCINQTIGDDSAGNGLNGEYTFIVDKEDIEDGVGYIVVVANSADMFYFYDIIEITPVHDLIIKITEPFTSNNQSFTVGLPQDIQIEVTNQHDKEIYDIDTVLCELLDEKENVLQSVNLRKKSENIWYIDDWIPHFKGTIVITATNNSGGNEHTGNITFNSDYALISYEPQKITVGIQLKNITINISATDANGNPLSKGTKLYLNIENATDTTVKQGTSTAISLKQGGIGSFILSVVGDIPGFINCSLQGSYDAAYDGNKTSGSLFLIYPTFIIDPWVIFIDKANTVDIYAYDYQNNPIKDIYITLLPSSISVLSVQPEPVKTDENGHVTLSVSPVTSGTMNITLPRNVKYVNGQLTWTNTVVTDTQITAASSKYLKIELSKSIIYQGENLTILIKSDDSSVEGVTVTFGEQSKVTDQNGKVLFMVPDPTIQSAVFTIIAEKTGFEKAEKTITVIKVYKIQILGPEKVEGGSEFSISIIGNGRPLAGATIVFRNKSMLSDADGKVMLSAPTDKGTYELKAMYEGFQDGSYDIKVIQASIPGFEIFIFIAAAIIVGSILLLLKKKK